MKPSQLKQWMSRHNKSTADVASFAKISTRTVERFLKGGHELHPLIVTQLIVMMCQPPEELKKSS